MWRCFVLLLLWTSSEGGGGGKANVSALIHYSSAGFYEKLRSGKMMFIYFELHVAAVSQSLALFLVELENSAEALKDYGVLVGKVNCDKEQIQPYCTSHAPTHSAFLFRGGKEFLGFDLDAVFDVDSIVSEVLFAILRDEVKYVRTDADLLALEKSSRGKKDVVLGYVRSLGTADHRSLMETAYVYGSQYQFILITGGPVMKTLGVGGASASSRVWFLHCRIVDGVPMSARCPLTPMRKRLSTLSLHAFLQLMEAPLLSEVYDDPSSVPPPHFPYQRTPQVFLFSRPATARLDRDAASAVAWGLRGVALLLLVHRGSPAVLTAPQHNVAYRLPEEGPEVKYLTLTSLDEVLEFFLRDQKEDDDDDEEEEDEDFHHGDEEILDDEISASVHEKRAEELDMDSITQLTSDNLHGAVSKHGLTVALFYLQWEAVSLTVLRSFIAVAQRLADSEAEVLMGAVDCGEWGDLCASVAAQPITAFPTILLLRPHRPPQLYRGMLGSGPLLRFILMSCSPAPLLLSSEEAVTSFLQEAPHPQLVGSKLHRVLGLFLSPTQPGWSVFTEAAAALRGEVLTGLLTPELAHQWAAAHHVGPPSVLVFPSWAALPPSRVSMTSSSVELLASINSALLPPLPEVTVETLPSLLSLGKALLLLFVGEEEDQVGRRQNQDLLEEMRAALRLGGDRMERYLACWVHLGHTPAAGEVLTAFLGTTPLLPALLLTHIPSRDEVYQFPPSSPLEGGAVLQWLQRVEGGAEPPAGTLAEDRWPPPGDFYDFLKIMDAHERDSILEEEEEEEVDVKEHLVAMETTDNKRPDIHSEL